LVYHITTRVTEMRAAVDESDRERTGLMLPVFTVALVLALFAGIVLLVADGVSSFSSGSNGRIAREGAGLMERIGALIRCTRVINEPIPLVGSRSYDFLADIDGDPRTGRFGDTGYGKGLERVVIYRSGGRSTELTVAVYTVPHGRPNSAVLTRNLDPGDPDAFSIDCTFESHARNVESSVQKNRLYEYPVRVRVSLVLGPLKGEAAGSRKFSEVIPLRALVAQSNP
jgi:hypothetical protein